MSLFETLHEEVDLMKVAEGHLDLTRSGRTAKCRCPYPDHEDKIPSFHVYPDGRFFCFGCRKHGDVVDLWAVLKGLRPGIEAALDLARKYEVAFTDIDPRDLESEAWKKKAEERRDLEARYATQAEEAHGRLQEHPEIVDWWEGRGFDDDLRQRFLLGATDDGSAATIPFYNRGRIQGLIRRNLQSEPKYVLSKAEEFPDGCKPLFIPGSIRKQVVLVEGYVDALALTALGFDAAAVGGTWMNQYQRDEIQGLPCPVYIMPDNDDEGRKAGKRWARDLYPHAVLCSSEYERGEE